MSWMQTIPMIVIGLLVLIIPGALLARAMGAHGLTLWSAAIPLTFSLASASAVGLQLLHINWSLPAMIATTLFVTILAASARIMWLRRRSGSWPRFQLALVSSPTRVAAYLLAIGIPGAIIAYRFSKIFGGPEHISQTYDNVFHLNALRLIMDSGRASSLTLGSLDPHSTRLSFYPAAWHDVVALVIDATGASIPVGINVTNMIIAGIVWPMSAMFLVSTLTGRRLLPTLVTGALAAGFSSFPYAMVDFGVLYPNLLSIALFPFCLGAVVECLGLGRAVIGSRSLNIGLLAVASIGLALAHPSTLMALIAFAVSPLVFSSANRIPRPGVHRQLLRESMIPLVGVIAYGVVAMILWTKVRPSEVASFWPPTTTVARAIGEVLTSAPQGRDVPWLIFALTIVGIVILAMQRKLWILGCFIISAGFYVVVSGYPAGPIRSFWTGVWYNDSYRLAALLPVTAIVIAAVGGSWLIERGIQYVHRGPEFSRLPRRSIAIAGGLILIIAAASLAQGRTVDSAQSKAAQSYRSTVASPLLSSDEEALLKRLNSHVPADSVVIGNPWTGASLVYAFSGRQAMLPAVGTSPSSSEKLILNRLNSAAKDPGVCDVIRKENSFFVLDFGLREVHGGKHPYPGLAKLSEATGFQLVDSQGEARLYEVKACL